MKTFYALVTLFSILALSGCKPAKETLKSDKTFLNSIHSGKATSQELVSVKGEPTAKTPSITKPGSVAFNYPEGENYEVQEGKVIARFRAPKPEETSLNYWRNLFKDVQTKFSESSMSNDHEKIFELNAPSLGMAVLYNDTTKQVFRVVEHANQ